MRIIHIITGLYNGGAEAVLYRLCTNDKKAKHSVISLMDMGKYGPMLIEQGVNVICLNMPQGRVTFNGLIGLWRVLRSQKPDLVQTWMYHADLIGGVIAMLAGVKQVFWNIRQSDLDIKESKRSTILVAKICAKFSDFIPKKIICCAEQVAKVHAELGYQSKKMVVIGNGYELDKFYPNTESAKKLAEELDLTSGPLLGMVGRFHPQKDHKNLIDALVDLVNKGQDFRCLLVGPNMDTDNAELQSWIAQAGIQEKVILLGQRKDIVSIMNLLDVHVLSSAFGEGFPNVVAEAMACGTPCVVTNVGDAAVIVGQTGWVVPKRDSGALANTIQAALVEMKHAPDFWQQRKENCRKHIEDNFGIENMIEKYHQTWLSL